jgi:hypothetical protein
VRSGIWYTTAAALLTLVVAACSALLLEGAGRAGAWSGAAVAFAVQVIGFWLLFVWVLPRRHALAHGLGAMVRLALVAVVAMWLVPQAGLPAAPTLLTLVAVLFLTTLSEPIILRIVNSERR